MARSDAVAKTPTIEEEISKFKTFSTTDGEVSNGEPTAKERKVAAVNKDGASAEAAAASADDATTDANAQAAHSEAEQAATTGGTAATPAAVELTETEEANAIDAAQAAKGDDDLTEEEKDAAVAAALTAKTASARRRDPEKRIAQAVGRQRAAERQLAAEREERARERGAFEARLSALEKGGLTATTDDTTKDPNAPRAEDFDLGELDPKFIRALARYETKQELAAAAASQQKTSETTAQAAARAEFETKLTAFTQAGVKKFGDDFVSDVIESAKAGEWPLPAAIGPLLFDSPVGPDIAHFLSDPANLAEAQRIEKLSPTAQAVAFGRLEAKFSAAVAAAPGGKTPVTATKAPPVPQSRARGAGGKAQAVPETNDFKAFEAMAMAGKPN